MLYSTMELCLFCDAGLAHNAIFNYYLLPLFFFFKLLKKKNTITL